MTIVIADDHEIFRESISSLLTGKGGYEVLATCRNGLEVLKAVEELQPGLVLMDVKMPAIDGIKATESIKKDFPSIKVLALSMSDDPADIAGMIEAGADGYILKTADVIDFMEAVTLIANGKKYFPAQTVKAPSGHREGILLSKREIEIVRLIAMEYSAEEIAAQLFISHLTVEKHKNNIRRKLNTTTVGLVKFAIREGII
ncbi:response regulator transcription factor [uncultured Imperialibacter sp.]|uniref:response regulator transcription factor n=1 Tax=uncultured Imperialibacter sp. TaxID=1672639 RepID=UPI0030DCA4D2|tara:strand:- start:2535 stop:3137 length:603 start_codon:yes stop_codon:yes gene_type:complete